MEQIPAKSRSVRLISITVMTWCFHGSFWYEIFIALPRAHDRLPRSIRDTSGVCHCNTRHSATTRLNHSRNKQERERRRETGNKKYTLFVLQRYEMMYRQRGGRERERAKTGAIKCVCVYVLETAQCAMCVWVNDQWC